jgi:hypothetical protein
MVERAKHRPFYTLLKLHHRREEQMAPTMSPLLRCPAETNVVTDDGSRSDREGLKGP